MIHSNTQMFFIMLLSGLLSTMNIWVFEKDHMRLSVNDLYMIFLMIGWMFFFMGLFQENKITLLLSSFGVLLILFGIRYQFFVSENQFVKGMIVHHSMALTMAKRLQEKGIQSKTLENLVLNILKTQTEEIKIMKNLELS